MNTLPPARHEATDASPSGIALTAVGLALGIGLTLLASAWLYRGHARATARSAIAGKASTFQDGATEQTSLVKDWAEQDRLVRARLHSYGWVDRKAGVVRIPIDRAMSRLVEEASNAPRKGTP